MTNEIINIRSAEPAGDGRLHIVFDDNTDQIVDFRAFLQSSLHPDIRAYLEPTRFATFRIEYGDLVWGDYDLCFPIMDMYQNHLNKHDSLQAVA